jgi:hypothetical protein
MKIRTHKGMTLLGFLIALTVALFFAYAGLRVIPMYLEYYSLVSAMDALQKEPGARTMSPQKIKQSNRRRLWVSYADNNIESKHIRISKKSDGVNVQVKYEVRKPFLGNIDVVGKFDRTVVLR